MEDLYRGVCPVINTPFTDRGDPDLPGVARIVEYVLAAGCRDIALFAMNSEPHKMTLQEKETVLAAFLEAVGGRAHTLVGVVENPLRGAVQFARQARRQGADGLILFPPMVVPPAEKNLLAHFEALASEVDCPVMIQDAPRTTGVAMSDEFLVSAFERIPNLSYVKAECPLPVHRVARLVKATGGGLKCLTGNGGIFTVDGFKRGAWGVMPGIGVIRHFVRLWEHFAAGREDAARDVFENLMPLLWFEDQSLEFFVACEKTLLADRGVIDSPTVRTPGFVPDEPTLAELRLLHARLRDPE